MVTRIGFSREKMYGNIEYVTDWRKCEIKDPKDGHRIRGCGDVTVRHITNYGHPARKMGVTRLAACRVHNQSSSTIIKHNAISLKEKRHLKCFELKRGDNNKPDTEKINK